MSKLEAETLAATLAAMEQAVYQQAPALTAFTVALHFADQNGAHAFSRSCPNPSRPFIDMDEHVAVLPRAVLAELGANRAAPDLLAALKKVVELRDRQAGADEPDMPHIRAARAAIAKATQAGAA